MGRALDARRVTVWAAVAAVSLFGVFPMLNMLVQSVLIDGTVTLARYSDAFARPRLWMSLFDSLKLAGLSALLATVLGVALAFLVVKSTIPCKTLIVFAFCLPLLFPPYVLANGWVELRAISSRWLFTSLGGVMVLTTATLPIVILLSIAALSGVNPRVEEAARMYAPWPRVWRSVTMPMALPGVMLAAILALLLAFGEYAAPSLLRLKVFPVESFTQLSAFYDPGASIAAWTPMLLVVVMSLFAAEKILGSGDRYFRWFIASEAQMSLGSWTPVVLAAIAALAGTIVLLPCAGLVLRGSSDSPFLETLSQAWLVGGDAIAWSLIYSSLAATAVTILGFLLGYASQRKLLPAAKLFGLITLILFALPGPLAGFAAAVSWNTTRTQWIYASSAALILAFSMQYAAVGQIGFASAFSRMSPSLEEAAQIAGAGWFRRVFYVLLPMQRRTIVGVWMLVFILSLRDTTLPLLLSPPGRDTLSARTLTLMANGSESVTATLGLLSILIAAIPAILGMLWFRRSGA